MDNVKKDINQFNELHPNRKLAVFGIILFVFILSILVGIYYSRSNGLSPILQTDTDQEAVEETPETFLTIVPSAESVAVGETVDISVMLDGDAVTVADITVTYDPTVFAAPSEVVNGTAFASLVREEIEDGMVSVTATVDTSDISSVSTGEVFSFTLEAIGAGSSELNFDLDKTVTAINGDDTLQNAQGITISVQ